MGTPQCHQHRQCCQADGLHRAVPVCRECIYVHCAEVGWWGIQGSLGPRRSWGAVGVLGDKGTPQHHRHHQLCQADGELPLG